ncbi:MAG: ribosome biogenesis/translation initiation ATPase RLI [Candidatus Woesearchaeota archaeon]
MSRIAVVDNAKLKDMDRKKYIQRLCPVNRTGKECIYFDGNKLMIAENLCIGCGICVKAAPHAISIINLPEELESQAIHRYGENAFKLYNLPIPLFGKVVGILGVNGIGKSTAIKILAGILKPNLGTIGNSAEYSDLVQHFKGTEAQIFFEKLDKGEIVLSYKPQHVEAIPQAHSGTVRSLLERANQKDSLEEVAKRLDIFSLLDHDIKTISGGELQRVAIAATVLKKANLYIFDEPTSYLDIKQRMNVSNFIKELADEKTAVMVVEHDLIILDYMTDLVHMMYGKEDVYGVVGLPKVTKTGINVYLSGYLKEENVRFRNYPITFGIKSDEKRIATPELISWNNLALTQGTFSLKAPHGVLHEERVVGVLGENGIGKTTFVKILAGVLKQQNGFINGSVRVSYKPQYIPQRSVIVADIVHEALAKYKQLLIDDLMIEPLLEKRVDELSGGQLQRVALAECLAKDAEVYLLDEPSAYLDVEQRLKISKIIKEMMRIKRSSAIVVDHDLLFLDYLSDELIVFDGVPTKEGTVMGPMPMVDGMNHFLKDLQMTYRRDEENKRPRANKQGSQMDQKQKKENRLYY